MLFLNKNQGSSPHLRKYVYSITITVLLIATVVLATISALQRASDFHHSAAEERKHYLENEREKVRSRVETALAVITNEQAVQDASLQELLRQQVYKAHAVATWVNASFRHLPLGDRERLVIESVRPIRFNGERGYFFMTRHDGVEMLFADRPELEGTNLLSMKSGDGKPVIDDMIAISTSAEQEGFYRYDWTKPKQQGIHHPKLAFVKQFEPFGWFIGTGEYREDFENQRKIDVLQVLSSMKDPTGGYLFAGQWDGISLLGPAKGKNMWEVEDIDGIKVVQEIVAAAQQGGGFVTYRMPQGSDQPPSRKLSYVLPVPEWKWYVGSGVSIDAIDEILALKKKAYMQTQLYAVLASIAILIALLLLVRFISSRFFLTVESNLSRLTTFLQMSVHGIAPPVSQDLTFYEFEKIADDVETMVQQRDIVQKELKTERERLTNILEGTNVGTWEWNVQTGKTIFNERWAEIIGYSLGEISPVTINTWTRLTHPDDLKISEELIQRHFSGELPYYECEVRMRHKNGEWVWLLDRGKVAAWTKDGKPLLMMGTHQDITERKRADEALRESEEQFRQIITTVREGILRLDAEWRITYANSHLVAMFGYELDELIGQSFELLLHEEDLEDFSRRKHERQQGQHNQFERRFRTKEGHEIWAIVSASAVFDDNGFFTGSFGTITNITERKQSEEALRESEARFKALHNASFGGIAIHDKGIILECNQGLSEMSGYSIDELIGMDGLLLISEKTRGMVLQNILTEYEKPYESLGLRKNNEEYPIRLEARNVPYKGKYVRVVEFRNITEQKRQEEEKKQLQSKLLQSQRMEAVGLLAGGVAHDFNNMLGVIIGYVELILAQMDPSQQFHSQLEEIQKAARRSADLTRQLLTFARKQTVAPQVLDLNQTIEGTLNMLRRLIGENINLIWIPGYGLWPINMDPSQIDQILANLCVNARDAIAGVGKLTVETKNATFDEEYCATHAGSLPGEYLRITVSDTGCGMDKGTLAQIFEPFFTTKDVGEGTGLGLATVYGAVKQNNGFINAYSEPGQGSTFTIYIPRHVEATTETRVTASTEPVEHGDEMVMLVEDEPTLLQMSKAMLERLGYTVLAAGTPSEAIRLAGEYPDQIQLLATDVIMPEMNGHELSLRLLESRPEMKCLFISGYTANIIANQGVLEKGVPFLQKPFSINELAAKVRETLER